MAKKINNKYFILIFIFIMVASGIILTERKFFIAYFMNHSDKHFSDVDLLVVLGGGIKSKGELGFSTKERLDELLRIYKEMGNPLILISEYPRGRVKMENYLIENNLEKEKFVDTGILYNESLGGTVNNMFELLKYCRKNKNIKRISIITSPYHEKRVFFILKSLRKLFPDKNNIEIGFNHINGFGEVLSCKISRFFKLITHEVAGLIYFSWNEKEIHKKLKGFL